MSLFLLMLMLGVANWFATTLLVESELFRPVRDWVGARYEAANGPRSAAVWHKLHYLVSCHMCAGTWVALAMALFTPAVVNVPVVGWLLTALVIKGIGHLVLLFNNKGNARIELDRAEAAAAALSMLPELDSKFSGLLNRHQAASDRDVQGRRDQFTDEDFAEMDAPEPDAVWVPDDDAAFAKPETKF